MPQPVPNAALMEKSSPEAPKNDPVKEVSFPEEEELAIFAVNSLDYNAPLPQMPSQDILNSTSSVDFQVTDGSGISVKPTSSGATNASKFSSLAQWFKRQRKSEAAVKYVQKQVHTSHNGTPGQNDVIEFSSPIYYCTEDSGTVSCEVVRLGPCECNSSVHYHTEDGSATEDLKYKSVAGELYFAPGESSKVIDVNIIQNETFDTTLEFQVILEDASMAKLGSYLSACRVCICDDDTFPTNRFKDQLLNYDVADVPSWPLLVEYLKFHMRHKPTFWSGVLNIASDQFCNLTHVYLVFLTNLLIDEGVNPSGGDMGLVWIIALSCLLPPMLVWFLDRQKLVRRLRGKAITQLQENLMRKFMNYDAGSRNIVSNSDLTMAITRDVPELVDSGFLTAFRLLRSTGLLILFSIYTINQMRNMSLAFLCILFGAYPILLGGFLILRHTGTLHRRKGVFKAETEVIGLVQQSTECFRLIADYNQRPLIVRHFTEKVKAANAAFTNSAMWENSSKHFVPLLNAIIVSCFMVLVGPLVISEEIKIGRFVTGIALCKGIGNAYEDIYGHLLEMLAALAPLQNVVHYMNLPSDAIKRLKLTQERLKEGHERRKSFAQTRSRSGSKVSTEVIADGKSNSGERSSIPPIDQVSSLKDLVDSMEIRADNLTFSYPEMTGGGVKILNEASFMIPQGRLISVTGPKGSGKATLLELLAGVVLPDTDGYVHRGALFTPQHLRVLHVSSQPMLLADFDIFENICFGPSDGMDERPERVMSICQRLGMSKELMGKLNRDRQKGRFSHANMQKLGDPSRINHIESYMSDLSASCTTKDAMLTTGSGTPVSVAARSHAQACAKVEALLSYTDKCLVHLARALVMNPEVLVLHKPLVNFDGFHAFCIMDLLRHFVNHRGLEQVNEEYSLRRPRTCIYSTATSIDTDRADIIFHIENGKVRSVDKNAQEVLKKTSRELFKRLDKDRDSHVSRQEFVEVMQVTPWAMRLLRLPHVPPNGDMTEVERHLHRIFDALDTNDSGDVDMEELSKFIMSFVDNKLVDTLDYIGELAQQNWESPAVAIESGMGDTPLSPADCGLPERHTPKDVLD